MMNTVQFIRSGQMAKILTKELGRRVWSIEIDAFANQVGAVKQHTSNNRLGGSKTILYPIAAKEELKRLI